MKVLLTNDDGAYAPGLWALARALLAAGMQVVVVVPDREQSGVGTSISLHNPLRITRPNPLVEGVETYSVEGTPGDSVILALGYLVKEGVNLVISGINEGANLGNDVYISGTVGAAFQASFYGVPALALSVSSLNCCQFEPAAKLAILIARRLELGLFCPRFLLNINVPNLPLYDIQGLEITRLARRSYTDVVQEGWDGKRKYYWIVRGKPEWTMEPGTDVYAVHYGMISVTSLGSNNAELITCLKGLAFPLYVDLLTAGAQPL